MENEEFYSFDVYYTDTISIELDESIHSFIKEYFKDVLSINCEWYYSEFTVSNPTYRLIGFEISRELTELERFALIDSLIMEYDGYVKPQ